MKALRGKGVYVRQIRHLDTDPLAAARKFAGWGFSFAAPTVVSSGGASNRQLAFYQECQRLGVAVIPHWFLPKPDTWRTQIEDFFAFVDELRQAGVPPAAVMIDPEVEWRGNPAEASAFASALATMAKARGCPVVLTTYAMPPPDFPLEAFAEHADMGLAQTYYITSTYGTSIFERSLARWRSRGFAKKPVVLAGSYWQKYVTPERPKTLEDWQTFIAALPPTPGLCIWPTQSWGGAIVPLLQATKAWSPGVVPTGARVLLSGLPFGETVANAIFGG